MRYWWLGGPVVLILALVGASYFSHGVDRSDEGHDNSVNVGVNNMKISSPDFENNGNIPMRFTCDGEDLAPRLVVNGTPAGAKSLALVVDDPDAPRGDWVHWLIWNLPPTMDQIQQSRLSTGAVEGLTDFGKRGYGGPCPPAGEHRYFFKLYALDTILDLSAQAKKPDLLRAMTGHILEQAELMGKYQRP